MDGRTGKAMCSAKCPRLKKSKETILRRKVVSVHRRGKRFRRNCNFYWTSQKLKSQSEERNKSISVSCKCNQNEKFLTVRQMAQLTQVIELLSKLDLTWCHNFIALAHFQHFKRKQIKIIFEIQTNGEFWLVKRFVLMALLPPLFRIGLRNSLKRYVIVTLLL